MDADPTDAIGLAEAVQQIRAELQRAAAGGAGQPIAFIPSSVELSLEVVFERKGGADAGVRVWVVTAAAKGEIRSARTQKVTVKLEPIDPKTGQPPRISDVGPY